MERSGILEFEIDSHIAVLKINNPPKNRLSDPVIVAPEVLKKWLNTPGLRGAVLTGEGNNFSEGADLDSIQTLRTNPEEMERKLNQGKKVLSILKESPVPVMAAIKGACFGGGLEIALACHVRIAANTALFAFPEADLGILPGLGGTLYCVEEIMLNYALPFILSSEMLSGEKALELGLVQYLVPRKEVFSKAIQLLNSIVDGKETYVINTIMKAVVNGQRMDSTHALEEESRMFCDLITQRNAGLAGR